MDRYVVTRPALKPPTENRMPHFVPESDPDQAIIVAAIRATYAIRFGAELGLPDLQVWRFYYRWGDGDALYERLRSSISAGIERPPPRRLLN
jgi:hypothetical protein